MLVKLTGIPHPELHGGKAQPIYIDASRVLLIMQGYYTANRIGSQKLKKELYDKLYFASTKLSSKANEYMPDMADPVAIQWLRTINSTAAEVNSAFKAWGASYNSDDYYPPVDCTEVQLACGTALEHGVMLTRTWVSETPEEVYGIVTSALDRP